MGSSFVVGGLLWRCRTVKNATNQPVVRAPDLEAVDTDPDHALEDEDAEADRDLEVAADVKEVIQGQGPGPGLQRSDQAGTLDGSEVILEVDLEVDPNPKLLKRPIQVKK